MALLTGWTGKTGYTGKNNRVDIEPLRTYSVHVAFEALAGIWYNVYNDYTVQRFAFVGMNKDTAVLCAAAFQDSDNGINATPTRQSGHMWACEVAQCTVTTRQEAVTP